MKLRFLGLLTISLLSCSFLFAEAKMTTNDAQKQLSLASKLNQSAQTYYKYALLANNQITKQKFANIANAFSEASQHHGAFVTKARIIQVNDYYSE